MAVALSVLILVNQTVGVACQFIQHTDPRLPLVYFTIDSAVLAGVAAALTLGGATGAWVQRLRLAAVVGVGLSAIVFASVIAPASPTGTWFQPHDDLAVRTATLLLHGVAPVLVTTEYVVRPTCLSGRDSVRWSYAWPLSYLLGIAVLAAVAGAAAIPYPFLRPAVSGWPTTVGAYVGLIAVVGLLGWIVGALADTCGRGRRIDDPAGVESD